MTNARVKEHPASSWKWLRGFSLDLRSLAAMRIGIGLMVMVDACVRWGAAEVFYSDAGYYTRDLNEKWIESTNAPSSRHLVWSVYFLSGSLVVSRTWMVLQFVFAAAYAAGYRTRLVNAVLWILVASLQVRCPVITSSGDTILKLILFWSMFLPTGRVWSLDSKRDRQRREANPILSFSTAAIVLQVVLMYFFTGLAKWNSVWWSGEAMDYILRLDIYATPFGESLLRFEWLPPLVSWSTLFIEIVGIWLVLIPWKNSLFRIAVAVTYMAFHFGIGLSMSIGLFPYICMVVWLMFLPGSFWDWMGLKLDREPAAPDGYSYWSLPAVGRNIFCSFMIMVVLLWNVSNIDPPKYHRFLPPVLQQIGTLASINQHFQMFGVPPADSPWFVYRATLTDGSEVDLFSADEVVRQDRPQRTSESYPDLNWRKLHRNMLSDHLEPLRQPLLEYFVRRWNENHAAGRQVKSAEMIQMLAAIGPIDDKRGIRSAVWATWQSPDSRNGWRFDEMLRRRNQGTAPRF